MVEGSVCLSHRPVRSSGSGATESAARKGTWLSPPPKTLETGIDPMAERRAENDAKKNEVKARQRAAENSFEKVARRWWEWWKIGKSPRHADTVMRRLQADVFPAYGHKLIDTITAADIRELMIASRGTRRTRCC
jgi:hypothetical protein